MTKTEVIHFMEKIKAHYQSFKMDEEYIINEWADKLKPYDIEDVYRKFDEHLSGNYADEIPKLHFITKYLKTPNEKKVSSEYSIRCCLCGKICPKEEFDEHYDRCCSIDYLCRTSKKYFNKGLSKEKLWELSNDDFERRYLEYCERLYEILEENSLEKKALENYILTARGFKPNYKVEELM